MNNIKSKRIEKGITQEALAAKVGLTQSNISRIESEGVFPNVKTAAAIASALECSMDELFGEYDGEENDEGRI